jgi:hypothetical protein
VSPLEELAEYCGTNGYVTPAFDPHWKSFRLHAVISVNGRHRNNSKEYDIFLAVATVNSGVVLNQLAAEMLKEFKAAE